MPMSTCKDVIPILLAPSALRGNLNYSILTFGALDFSQEKNRKMRHYGLMTNSCVSEQALIAVRGLFVFPLMGCPTIYSQHLT